MDTVVVDACLVISFGNAGRLDLLSSTTERRTIVPPKSANEVSRPPASVDLADAIARGLIVKEGINLENAAEQDALRVANAVPAFRDRGDAEVLALAQTRGWMVGSDDEALRSHAALALGPGRLAGVLDFIVWAIRDGRLTLTEAEDLLRRLDVGPELATRLSKVGKALKDLI